MESFRSSSRPPKCTSHFGIGLDAEIAVLTTSILVFLLLGRAVVIPVAASVVGGLVDMDPLGSWHSPCVLFRRGRSHRESRFETQLSALVLCDLFGQAYRRAEGPSLCS